ncbi:MAG: nucleotidyltransferase domain-containing protein [Planctomycetes bacterium]|nr:nucleotidyltransferase domain-containing protein [Planctomycetota bacterium]
MDFPDALDIPPPHREFLRRAVSVLCRDERIVGIAVAGSLAEGGADEWSDVDLVVAVEPDRHQSVLEDRHRLAAALGDLAAAFTGEHVGEPRLLVCLYDNPVLHVDLKFVPLPDAVPVVDNPVVLWARDGRLEAVLRQRVGAYPLPDRQWSEDRFWIWIHYLAGKIARGELFEAMEGLSFLRVTVLAPLGLANAGTSSSGVRRVEEKSPELAGALAATVAEYDRDSLRTALEAAVTLYRRLRAESGEPVVRRGEAEGIAVRTLAEVRTGAG